MKFFALWMVLGVATAAFAQDEFDPCTDPSTVALNRWLLTVNDADRSDRQDLLQTMRLLSEGGFSVAHIFAYDSHPDITISIGFDPSYWGDPNTAKMKKNEVLRSLSDISGNLLRCDPLAFPAPAIGVRSN